MADSRSTAAAEAWRAMPGASLITDVNQRILRANETFCRLTGYSESELLGENCRILQGSTTDPASVRAMRGALTAGQPFRGVLLNQRKDGSSFWNLLAIDPVRDDQGCLTHFVSTQIDITEITERGQTATLLMDLANRLYSQSGRDKVAEAVAEAVHGLGIDRSAVALLDEATGQLRVVAAAGWGERARQALQFHTALSESPELAEMLTDPSPRLFNEHTSSWLAEVLRSYGNSAFIAAPILSDGAVIHGLLLALWSSTAPPSVLPDLLCERLTGVAGIAGVALRNAELIEQVQHAAQFDDLTGLANRRTTRQRLVAALERRHGPVGVVFCDVDRFKWINAAFGHDGGDQALRQLAGRIRDLAPRGATVGRSGGDEFVVVIPHMHDHQDAERFVRSLEAASKNRITVHGNEMYVTLSMGTASGEAIAGMSIAETASDILRRADTAMFRVKETRQSRILDGGAEMLQLDTDLHHAVQRGEIAAHFQPQYDLRSGDLTGFEALARWHHPVYGLIEPTRFILLAEDDGLIHEIGTEVLRQTCSFADQMGAPLQYQVNVSGRQLDGSGLIDQIVRALAHHPGRPWQLNVEVTESVLASDPAGARRELAALREFGVGVAIDDFGNGYSSLSQLRDLPATELKIDKSFVHRQDPVGVSILSAVVTLAGHLGLTVVAEGVETLDQLTTLRSLGCDRGQGFLFSAALAPQQALLATRTVKGLFHKAPPDDPEAHLPVGSAPGVPG